MRIRLFVAILMAVSLTAAGCSSDSDDAPEVSEATTPSNPVTTVASEPTTTTVKNTTTSVVVDADRVAFETEVDFSTRPVTGTFEVTEGADVLGCSSGTFEDSGSPTDGVQRVMTCDSGSNEGSFSVALTFEAIAGTVSDNGTWSVAEGSDDFDGLQASGDWSIVYDQTGGGSGVGAWTGDINYTS